MEKFLTMSLATERPSQSLDSPQFLWELCQYKMVYSPGATFQLPGAPLRHMGFVLSLLGMCDPAR